MGELPKEKTGRTNRPEKLPRVVSYDLILHLRWDKELICERCTEAYKQGYIAGSAFTNWKCLDCNGDHIHPNTGHPDICLGCAIQYGKCQRCLKPLGKNLTLVPIRKGD